MTALLSLDLVKTKLRGYFFTPDHDDYRRLVKRWSPNEEGRPALVFQPVCEEDVALAVQFATSNNYEIAVVGGGHSFMAASSSDTGIHIDMRLMRDVYVENPHFGADGIMHVQGGATVADVAIANEDTGTWTTIPAHKSLGYFGFALGGGFGAISGITSLAIDNFVEARVVLASGEVVTASITSHPDLFWAIKGAGYNFGVVTSLKVKVIGLPKKLFLGTIVYPPLSYEALFEAIDCYVRTQQPDEQISLFWASGDPTNPSRGDAIVVFPFLQGSEEEAHRRFKFLFDIPHISADCSLRTQLQVSDAAPEAVWDYTNRFSNGVHVATMSPKVWIPTFSRLKQWADEEPSRKKGTSIFFGLNHRGKILENQGPEYASAWPPVRCVPPASTGASFWFDIAIYTSTDKNADKSSAIKIGKEIEEIIYDKQRKLLGNNDGEGQKYPNAALHPGTEAATIFRENYPRLQKVKAEYDPRNVFHRKHPITPAA